MDWSLFCAYQMEPGKISPYEVTADVPPRWSSTMKWVPLLGNYLNVLAQSQGYTAPLEGVTDFIAADLDNPASPYIRKRVGYKVVSDS